MLQRFRPVFTLLLVLSFSTMLMGDESETTQYFPDTLGSYWVYENQDGNELARHAIEGEEIAGETYRAFNYEPALENWADYDYYVRPNLYQLGEEWVTFLVGAEVEKAIKARLTKEMEAFLKIAKEMGPPNILYDVKAEAQDPFYVLPTPVAFNEEWDATQIKAQLTMKPDPPQDPGNVRFDFTIVETGNVLGTENVEAPAGTFEDCLKIEYRTKTRVIISPPEAGDGINPPGESVTTLWIAPNVGIVKFHQEYEDILLKIIPIPNVVSSTTVKTLELTKYEIKSADLEKDESN